MSGHNPLYAASHMQHMADRAKNDKLALAMTVISVGLLGTMLARELKEMWSEKGKQDCCRKWDHHQAAGRER